MILRPNIGKTVRPYHSEMLAGASSITVAGSDVYVAGWKWEPSGSGAVAVAKYLEKRTGDISHRWHQRGVCKLYNC
jgi:hypothetical protein